MPSNFFSRRWKQSDAKGRSFHLSNGYAGTSSQALLGACYVHGNAEIGKRVAKKMLQHRKQVSTSHITLSNVYASAGMWNEAYGVSDLEFWRFYKSAHLSPQTIRLFEAAHATVFTVGDSSGWDFSMGNWTDGKHFKAGDVLVFNYDASVHNVVAVDLNGYNRCSTSANSRTYTSGEDRIMVSKGNHYFICSYPGHCDAGMKIAVFAS
ncbi:unnamed protein product [Fraxinus pennsylvanica]|uniref:Basic blue protein n=1 Tax=Fraxinus pennsylvanica TaxID=56036 RepID=A0AAD2E0V4_9LAMI|nr:unnamed protein product [Fraxinus pennsylvanica]